MDSTFKDKLKDTGLLALRLGIGLMFVLHGLPKILGGPEKWTHIGGAIGYLGIGFAPAFWGFMAATSEFFGGILLITGFLTRPAAAFMLAVMITAVSMHLGRGDGLTVASHAIEDGIVFFSLILTGPGGYNLGKVIERLLVDTKTTKIL